MLSAFERRPEGDRSGPAARVVCVTTRMNPSRKCHRARPLAQDTPPVAPVRSCQRRMPDVRVHPVRPHTSATRRCRHRTRHAKVRRTCWHDPDRRRIQPDPGRTVPSRQASLRRGRRRTDARPRHGRRRPCPDHPRRPVILTEVSERACAYRIAAARPMRSYVAIRLRPRSSPGTAARSPRARCSPGARSTSRA